MAKRRTKEQRIEAEKAALLRRVEDMWLAATQEEWDGECEPWPTEWMNFVNATRKAFLIEENKDTGVIGNEYLWGLYNLDRFHNPESATEALYESGVRA